MRRLILFVSLTLIACRVCDAQYRSRYPLPTAQIPGSLGVNIHFTKPQPGEIEQLAAAGFKWIRMDFAWAGVEHERGKFDFSAYDGLMAVLKPHGIRPIFILDYGNDLYEKGSPRSGPAREAFARFAAEAVTHFRGQGIVWEMWNEPNIQFWQPKPDVGEYAALALETGKAIRKAAPEEWYVGPGVSGMDMLFMERCFKEGMLNYWDAVSFHPYRNTNPETAEADFHATRAMIDRYAPSGKKIPMINSEWGYSELYRSLNVEKQGKYIVRQALFNVSQALAISIYYDWHDDGTDPKEVEHHFGTVTTDYRLKPAYQAMQTLTRTLGGFNFSKRLALDDPRDYCLLFTKGKQIGLAIWTTNPDVHTVRISDYPGRFVSVGYLGEKSSVTMSGDAEVAAGDAPVYLISSRSKEAR